MSEKKIELIAQLLAKAESTTPEEAEALTEAATKLMAKYMIDQATIDAKRGKEGKSRESIVRESETMRGSYQKPMMDLWFTVGQAYGPLRFLKSNGRNTINFIIIGHESDVAQFRALGKSLEIQATVAMREWWLKHKSDYAFETTQGKWEARSAFLTAFARGAASRMRTSKQEALNEAAPGTDLVLADRSALVEAHFAGLGSRKGRATRGYYDGNATAAGYAAGQNANTGQRRQGISA